ncbi:MAG: NAD(P) transhydrogenase subunit alpha [Actinophytocola sp.]|uniref:NAD(P) transhydrogenase subunit alpha n=1 Tax=Actinophytocola sp. TaxID=1872138 RepID=UPI001322FE17|nr:NAD(P) transhydrogenase subunit alpha [Actinophytocola sp.]MPZ85073.1 NAD(P) transhydrogenase subunit alpha [Actinophytocola sp.]
MGTITVGVIRERAPGEHRVALVPDSVRRLRSVGVDVLVEASAGIGAWFTDGAYEAAGATVVPPGELRARADVLLCVGPPDIDPHPGQAVVGLLEPLTRPDLVRRFVEQGVTAVSLDMLPRTLSRAQSMDALTSQANIAGYKAVLLAADTYGRYLPMLTTAAGTFKPAAVLVLGAGVAGLQAIGTARRLGALVTAYDVRSEARAESESLGARFLELVPVESASGVDGYARELTGAEQQAQQEGLDNEIARFDIVITTARVPGRRPPVLVTARALRRMRPGSVVVDLAASPFGGNVERATGTAVHAGRVTVLDNGVTVIDADDLPSRMAPAASTAYARNVVALLTHLVHDGALAIDLTDEIQAGVVITHQGEVVNPVVLQDRGNSAPLTLTGGTR